MNKHLKFNDLNRTLKFSTLLTATHVSGATSQRGLCWGIPDNYQHQSRWLSKANRGVTRRSPWLWGWASRRPGAGGAGGSGLQPTSSYGIDWWRLLMTEWRRRRPLAVLGPPVHQVWPFKLKFPSQALFGFANIHLYLFPTGPGT